jgi:hypothetical protein
VQANHEFLTGKVIAEACFSDVSGLNPDGDGACANCPKWLSFCPNGGPSQVGPGAADTTVECLAGLDGGEVCTHGTHVAGIAAGLNTSQQAGEPANGVAKFGTIFAIQIYTAYMDFGLCNPACIGSFDSDQIKALDHVFANIDLPGGVKVAAVNMSLGGDQNSGTCDSLPHKQAIDNLRSAGVLTVIASGNGGSTDSISSPGCISTAVTVGSTTKQDALSSFSNMSSVVDVLAPGENIQSSVPAAGGSTTTYAFLGGTSMAAAHVAGAIAAIRSACPSVTVTQIEDALKSTGTPITDTRSGGTLTKPRIRVDLAVQSLGCQGPAPTCTIAYSPTTVAIGQGLTVTWNAQNATSRSYVLKTASGSLVFGPSSPTLSGSIVIASFSDLSPGTYVRTDTVTGPGGTATCSATLTVTQPAPAPTCTISYSPTTVVLGQGLTVAWDAQNATSRSYVLKTASGSLVFGPSSPTLSGSVVIASFGDLGAGTYVRTDTVTGPGGTATCSATLTVTQPAPAPTCTISYSPTTVVIGQGLTVTWAAQNATSRSYVLRTASGSLVFGPSSPTLSGTLVIASFSDLSPGTYVRTDTVTGPGGTATCSATLTVT